MLDHCTYWIMVNSAFFVKSTPTAFSVSFNTLHVCYRHIKDNVAGVYWKPCLQPNSCLNFLQQFSVHTVLYMSILNIFYQRAWARGNSWFKCKSVEEGKDQEFIQSNIIPDLSRERNSGRWLYTQSLRIGIIKTYNLSGGDFLGPPYSTDKTTLIIKVRLNWYNQIPYLTTFSSL